MLGEKKKLAFGLNLVLLVYLLHFFLPLGGFILSIIINLMVFVVPGAAWRGIWRRRKIRDPVEEIIFMIIASTIILLVGVVGHFLLGVEISSTSHFIYLAVITNLGLVFVKSPQRGADAIRPGRLALCIALLTYILIYLGATRLVPPLEDHDMETQGTAWALLNRLKPLHLTDRGTTHFFAHPLLLHFYNAHTILFWDVLNELRWYEEDASLGEKILNTKLLEGTEISFITQDGQEIKRKVKTTHNEKIILDEGAPDAVSMIFIPHFDIPRFCPRKPLIKGQNSLNVQELRFWVISSFVEDEAVPRFKKTPFVLPTRMPNIFFSCLTAFILFCFIEKLTHSRFLAVLGLLLYFTFPEIFIRSSYGGYMAITNFGLFLLAYLYIEPSPSVDKRQAAGGVYATLLAALFLGLANHKAVILPMAIGMREFSARLGKEKILRVLKAAALHPAFIGFLAGTFLFWAYGLILKPDVFIQEHFQYHLINRIVHRADLGYTGYPAAWKLWKGFFWYPLGQPILFLGAIVLILALKELRKAENRKPALALWFLLGAFFFTVVDWRQTKHLMLLVPALVIGLFSYVPARRLFRLFLYGLAGLSILINILIIASVWQDFSVVGPAGGW